MTKKQKATLIKKIETHKAAIAKHRDALRDLISDVETICDNSDDAVRELECAVETLSQYL